MRRAAGILGLALAACMPDAQDAAWEPAAGIPPPLTPEVFSPYPAPPPADHLRVVSFNVELGADVERLAAAIADAPAIAGADVFLLQEIEDHPGEGGSRTAQLATRLALNYAYAPARVEGDGTHGLAILSRFPLADVEVMRLPHVDQTFHTRDRIALAADLVLGDARLRVVDVHLDTRINITDRIVQMHPAVIDLPARVVVGGDFNVNPYVWLGHVVPLVTADAITGFEQAVVFEDYMRDQGFASPTSTSGPTESNGLTDLRLDAIYPRGVTPGAIGVVREVQVSDHVPLWLDVAL
ncbi:MAG: endonuclease/exonuclease/phosphatase family protein [Deltaproteobacteria bacterium]|nr:endonuclease/exonuclease/phosphatase family protein [Deltaproteobacteria bacterium]